jgi:hypothetical protein
MSNRIFLSCLQDLKPHPLPAYDFWRQYLVKGAEEAGLSVIEAPGVDWAAGLLPLEREARRTWLADTWQRTLDFIRREHQRSPIRMFLGYLYPEQVDPAAIGELRRLGIPTVNFFCDNVREFRKVPEVYRGFDLHWVPEYEAMTMYQAAGLAHVHAPMPAWVPPEMRRADHSETEPATFIGSADVLRTALFSEALAGGADFVVRGRGWNGPAPSQSAVTTGSRTSVFINQWRFVRRFGVNGWVRKMQQRLRPLEAGTIPGERVGPTVSGDDYYRITQHAIVALGINRVPTFQRPLSNPLTYSRLRDIEAPMLGACYLTEWTEGLPHLYDLGDEIESYRTADELREKLAFLRRDTEKRQRMRRSAQRRALDRHSVAATLQRLTAALN